MQQESVTDRSSKELMTKAQANRQAESPVCLLTALCRRGIFASFFSGLFFCVLTELSWPQRSYAFCYKPTPPYKPYSFTSNAQVDDYNRKVDAFNKDLDSYRQWLSRSYDSYTTQFKEYLRCEAESYGKAFSGCFRPTPPRCRVRM